MRPKEMPIQVREAVNHSIEKTKQKQRTFRSDQINKLVHFFKNKRKNSLEELKKTTEDDKSG